MDSILELQKKFNAELIGGVSYHFLNNPVISWESGFIKGLTAICALFAIIDIVLKVQDQKRFALGFLNFAFYLTIILSCFGQINPRKFIDFNLSPKYDYAQKDYNSKSKNELGVTRTKTNITLDRDVYNAVAQFFDDLADTIKGKRKIVNKKTGEETDLQVIAFQSTTFFLKQIRIAKEQCVVSEGTPQYSKCLAAYIPKDAPVSSDGTVNEKQCTDPNTGQRILCRNGTEDLDEQGMTQAEKLSGGSTNVGWGDAIVRLFSYVVSAYTAVYLFFTDFVFSYLFPWLLYLLELVRSVISLFLLIGYGFGAAGMMFFVKLLTPLLLLDKYRKTVFKGYRTLLAMALFGFVSEIFLFFGTVLTLGLREASYNVAVPFMISTNLSGTEGAVEFTSTFALLLSMVYIAIITVLLIQIYALTKIPKACQMLTNLTIDGFVAMGGELAGMGVKLGAAIAGASLLAPLLAAGGGALVAGKMAAGAGAKAVAGASAGKGMVGSMMAKGGARGAIGNMLQRSAMGANNLAKGAVKGAEKGADFFGGKDAGDRVRGLFGQGGGPKTSGEDDGKAKLTRQVTDNSMGVNPEKGGSTSSGGGSKNDNLKSAKKGLTADSGDDKGGATSDSGKRKGADPFGGGDSGGAGFVADKSGSRGSGGAQAGFQEDRRSGLKKLIDKGRSKSKAFNALAGAAGSGAGILGGMGAGIMASKKAFDLIEKGAGGIMDAGVNSAMGKGGLSKNSINSLGKQSKRTAKEVNRATQESIRNTLNDEDTREKLAQWGQEVGLDSEDATFQANEDLNNAFASTEKSKMKANEYKELQGLMNKNDFEDDNERNEAYTKIMKMSNTRRMSETQQQALNEFKENNAQYQAFQKQKEFAMQQASLKMNKLNSVESKREVASLMRETGMGVANQEGVQEKMRQANQDYFDKQKDDLNSQMKMLEQHKSGERELSLEQRRNINASIASAGSSIKNNASLRRRMLGDQETIDNMYESGQLSDFEKKAISRAGDSNDYYSGLQAFSTKMRNNKLDVGEEYSVKFKGDEAVIFKGGKQTDMTSIDVNEISDPEMKDRINKFLDSYELYSQDQEAFSKDENGREIYSKAEIAQLVKIGSTFKR